MDLFELADALRARDAAANLAAAHAEESLTGWQAMAVAWILKYSETHYEFVSEDCTDAGYAAGIPRPNEPRAWGAMYRYCASHSHTEKAGNGWSIKRASPTTLWRSRHPSFSELKVSA
jgi:hypothetical protein